MWKMREDSKLGLRRCAAKNPSTFVFETGGYEIGGLIAAGHFNRLNMNAKYNVYVLFTGGGPQLRMPI